MCERFFPFFIFNPIFFWRCRKKRVKSGVSAGSDAFENLEFCSPIYLQVSNNVIDEWAAAAKAADTRHGQQHNVSSLNFWKSWQYRL